MLKSMRAQFNWITNSRLDISSPKSTAPGEADRNFTESKIKPFHSVVRHRINTIIEKLQSATIDQAAFRIAAY